MKLFKVCHPVSVTSSTFSPEIVYLIFDYFTHRDLYRTPPITFYESIMTNKHFKAITKVNAGETLNLTDKTSTVSILDLCNEMQLAHSRKSFQEDSHIQPFLQRAVQRHTFFSDLKQDGT